MYTLKIDKIEKVYFQAENKDVLQVTCTLTSSDEHAEDIERKLAFPLGTTKEEVQLELQKYLDNYNLEYKQKLENAERDAQHAQADQVIENLTGQEVSPTKEK